MFEGGRNDFQIFSHCLRVVVGVCSGFTWFMRWKTKNTILVGPTTEEF
jgi:hypothetical protein